MQFVPLALSLAGTAFKTIGAIRQSRQQEAQAKANAAASRHNAQQVYLRNAAETAIDRLRIREAIGEQRAALARTGMALDSGSPDFLTKTTKRNLQYQSDLREASRINEALTEMYQASRYRQQAKQIGASIPFTLLGGAISTGNDFIR